MMTVVMAAATSEVQVALAQAERPVESTQRLLFVERHQPIDSCNRDEHRSDLASLLDRLAFHESLREALHLGRMPYDEVLHGLDAGTHDLVEIECLRQKRVHHAVLLFAEVAVRHRNRHEHDEDRVHANVKRCLGQGTRAVPPDENLGIRTCSLSTKPRLWLDRITQILGALGDPPHRGSTQLLADLDVSELRELTCLADVKPTEDRKGLDLRVPTVLVGMVVLYPQFRGESRPSVWIEALRAGTPRARLS